MKFRGTPAIGALLLASCGLFDATGGGNGAAAPGRCVVAGHTASGWFCAADEVASLWTRAQCESQDAAWDAERDDGIATTCEAAWE